MSVKLSELLGDIARTLEDSDWVYEINYGETLRSIAPALVEFSKVAWEPHACIPSDESCAVCRFRSAMKEAGVTCE